MKVRHQLLLLPLVFVLIGCSYQPQRYAYQPQRGGPEAGLPSKPGSCFAKCLIQEQVEYDTVEYFVFTGNLDKEDVSLEVIETDIILEPASTKWVKKKADRNCLSSDPNDCMVWCLVEVPAVRETEAVLKDTSQTKNFIKKQSINVHLLQEGGFTDWREVVCANNINSDLIQSVQEALMSKGYDVGAISFNNRLGADTKAALVKYQREHGLPVGQLDFETLESLDVPY